MNPENTAFKKAVNSAIYVDKIELIAYTNRVLNTMQKHIRRKGFVKRYYQITYEQKDGIRRGTIRIEAESPLSSLHQLIRETYEEPETNYMFQLLTQRQSIVCPMTERYTVEQAFSENEKIRYMFLTSPIQNYFLKSEKVSMEERSGASIEAENQRTVPKEKKVQLSEIALEPDLEEEKKPVVAGKKQRDSHVQRRKEAKTNIGRVVKVTLENTHPPVWRRLILPSQISFADLHDILQIAFGWEEDHLHEFSFSGNYNMKEEEEEKVCVDDLLKECSKIRYIYDFGDCWVHKIVWEKDVIYKERHASLIKARGDHFMEDSGGVFAQEDEDARIPLDMEATNARLERYHFSPVRTRKEGQEFVDTVSGYIAIQKKKKDFLKNIRGMFETALKEGKMAQEAPSEVSREGERWMELYSENIREYSICKQEDSMKISEFLERIEKENLNNYYKYLQIPGEPATDKHGLAVRIAEFLEKHPEYLLYLLEEEEWKELTELAMREDGEIPLPAERTVIKALDAGVARLFFEETAESKKITIMLSSEAKNWLSGLRKVNTEALYRSLARFEKQAGLCMQAYGLIELDAFYAIYCSGWKDNITKEEFNRRVYWQLRMKNLVNTGQYRLDGKSYVCSRELDFEKMIILKTKATGIVDYPAWNRKKLLSLKEGFAKNYPEWDVYYAYLCESIGYTGKMAEKAIVEDYIAVLNGMSATELIELLQKRRKYGTIDAYTVAWQLAMRVSMNTGLPFLNGYTRTEYMKNGGVDLICTNLFTEEKLSQTVNTWQHLYELPPKVQLRLYDCVLLRNDQKRLREVLQTALSEGGENYEFSYILAVLLYRVGCIHESVELLRKLVRSCKEPSVQAVLEKAQSEERRHDGMVAYVDDFLMPEQKTVRNTAPKIGRNDKCPCGSGIKYKFCCGRNK